MERTKKKPTIWIDEFFFEIIKKSITIFCKFLFFNLVDLNVYNQKNIIADIYLKRSIAALPIFYTKIKIKIGKIVKWHMQILKFVHKLNLKPVLNSCL